MIEAFGIKTVEHGEALFHALRSGEVELTELDQAILNGPAITKLVGGATSNPHKDLTYVTGWENRADDFQDQRTRRRKKTRRRPGFGPEPQ